MGWWVGFALCALFANWLTARYGFVPAGFGLQVTAGTYAAGLALGFRDKVQDTMGRWGVLTAIGVGAFLSWWVAPNLAVASGVAFALSELADTAVYTPLRNRGWTRAVIASNLVGAVVDTVVFLWIAFGWAAVTGGLTGQVVGKLWATLAFVGVMNAVSVWHRNRSPRSGAHVHT
jgi:hypothetical protein